MKAALLMSSPPMAGHADWTASTTSTSSRITSSAAVESAVDAYATRVLKEMSPPEACIDKSLGPYVTSMLRCSLVEASDVTLLPDFDSLLELLEEHCSLSPELATKALTTIAAAVRTGIVPEPIRHHLKVDTTNAYRVAMFSANAEFEEDQEDALAPEEFPALSESAIKSPLKPDRLIPVDLLDDPSSPFAQQRQAEVVRHTPQEPLTDELKEDAFPPLDNASKPPSSRRKTKKATTSKKEAEDLAAVLFRSSRTRQSSTDSDRTPPSKVTESAPAVPQTYYDYSQNQYFQQQREACIQMLLSANTELSEDAAAEASLVANADVNMAHFLVQQAVGAPPVCRHMLNDMCYRSDCQFSHDVEGHTCLFWLRGRCGKGVSCRFLHGFSETALEGLAAEFGGGEVTSGATSQPVAIATTNLVSHNMQAAFSALQHEAGSPFSSFVPSFSYTAQPDNFLRSSWGDSSSLETAMQSLHERQDANGDSSFAKIATQGYHGAESFSASDDASRQTSQGDKTVKIPQNLWNPHINRDSQVFFIADPLERYAQVTKTVSRDDVIDLHFQSTKTFSVVLETVLPEKLRDFSEVWVVTGTGHHVGRSTHQKGGGALESAVLSWLTSQGYEFAQGRDRNGHGGAVLVKSL